MEYLIGAILAAAVCAFAMLTGFDRDRAFYPTVLIVIGSYYILFAAMGATARTLLIESLFLGLILAVAVAGFKTDLFLVAAGLAGHGVFDYFHHRFIGNPGVPAWWPGFCLAFDIVAGAWLAGMLTRRRD
jgi:hypothetical protein